MRGDIVQLVSQDLVALSRRWDLPDNFRHIPRNLSAREAMSTAFIMNYGDLALGWRAATQFARAREPLPVYLTADDQWIWRAYLAASNPGYTDDDVALALAMRDHTMAHERHSLEAYLLCEDATLTDVSRMTGVPKGAISAYEKLFFNVRDRFEDYLYLARQVYPNGRVEELYDRYLQNTPFGDLLRRAGYNSGKDYVTFLAGVRSPLLNDMVSGDMASRLEKVIMANAYIMASVGLLNQRDNAIGIHNAKGLIAAAKAGGQEQQERSGFDDASIASTLRVELIEAGRAGISPDVSRLHPTEGPIIDAELATP